MLRIRAHRFTSSACAISGSLSRAVRKPNAGIAKALRPSSPAVTVAERGLLSMTAISRSSHPDPGLDG